MFGVSSEVVYPRKDNCLNKTLVRFTPEIKEKFSEFIDKLYKKECEYNLSPIIHFIIL